MEIIVNMNNDEQKQKFLKSFDFMRLGQAINNESWQLAAMIIQRMDKESKACGINDFDKYFKSLRISVNRRNKAECKNILSMVVGRRVHLLDIAFLQ